MKFLTLFSVAIAAGTLSAAAQSTQSAQPATPSAAAAAGASVTGSPEGLAPEGALVSDSTVRPGDSDLVKAAKAARARRSKSTVLIDNKKVKEAKGGNVSEPTLPLPPIAPAPVTSNAISTPASLIGPPSADRAELEKRLAQLKKQDERLQAEALDPYTEDDGAVARRLTQLHDEIAKVQKDLAAASAKPATNQPPSLPPNLPADLPVPHP